MVKSLALRILLALIAIYQKAISPSLPARCRYYPTCSTYMRQSLLWHGLFTGLYLGLRRLGRCHPWGGSGPDFVPLPLSRYQYQPANIHPAWVYRDAYGYRSRLQHMWVA